MIASKYLMIDHTSPQFPSYEQQD